MSSCQITGIPTETWKEFRRMCLEQGVSANRKLRELIEAEVAMVGGGMDGVPGEIESRGTKHARQD